MTKRRAPVSIENALVRIAGTLDGGFDKMAEVTNRPAHRIRAWADPDKREQVPVRDAKLLDRACAAAGGGTPIFDFYHTALEAEGALEAAETSTLANLAANVMRECGEAGAALVEALADPSRRDEAAREVQEALETLKRALPALIGADAYERMFGTEEQPAHQTGPPRAH